MQPIKFTIHIAPVTKKNSSRIVRRGNFTKLLPSKAFEQYEIDAHIFMPHCEPIKTPVNVKAIYYMPTHRRVDKTNLESALLDVLVKYQVIADDNCNIVFSTDGSRVRYDRHNPRTEVEITEVIELESCRI